MPCLIIFGIVVTFLLIIMDSRKEKARIDHHRMLDEKFYRDMGQVLEKLTADRAARREKEKTEKTIGARSLDACWESNQKRKEY